VDEQGSASELDNTAVASSAPPHMSEAVDTYLGSVLELARLLGIEVRPTSNDSHAAREVWGMVRGPLVAQLNLSDDFFTPLVAAAIYEPDPSFTRWFVEPAVGAFGRLRVRRALLEYLMTGSNQERVGAAQAWYYTQLRRSDVHAPEVKGEAGSGGLGDFSDEWREAALREFVRNDSLTLRHYLVKYLPLDSPDAFSSNLRNLVDAALEIARALPRY